MPRFSFIVGTKDRTKEFAVLLSSLAEQQMRDFELVVVDQNADNRLTPLVKVRAAQATDHNFGTGGSVTVKHVRCRKVGLAKGRQRGTLRLAAGLEQRSVGLRPAFFGETDVG